MTLSKNLDDLKFDKKLKVAILPSFTLNGLDETFHVKCSEIGIRYQSYVADYNQYNQEILNPESDFYNFSPEIYEVCWEIIFIFHTAFPPPKENLWLKKKSTN